MTHWYGWLGLIFILVEVLWSLRALAVNAWRRAQGRILRDDNTEPAIFWLAAWTTLAIALVAA